MQNRKIILVGAGKMGGALLKGWIEQSIDPARIIVIEPDPLQAVFLQATYPVQVISSIATANLSVAPEVVILAVKPQQMHAVLADCMAFVQAGTLFISIAAGKTTGFFTSHLGKDAAIIRVMPNLPATVQKGATVLYAMPSVQEAQRQEAEKLFSAVGKIFWIEDETWMDAVTALSGSGPAYLFLLAESMAKAGERLGLPKDLARLLTNQTLLGSAELLVQATEPANRLREHVTSPGGTTEAALHVLMDTGDMGALLEQAMQAAYNRSQELAD